MAIDISPLKEICREGQAEELACTSTGILSCVRACALARARVRARMCNLWITKTCGHAGVRAYVQQIRDAVNR